MLLSMEGLLEGLEEPRPLVSSFFFVHRVDVSDADLFVVSSLRDHEEPRADQHSSLFFSVTTLSALRAAVSGTAKKIVRISGIIQGDGEVVDIGSYTTLLGVNGGGADGLTNGGLRVKKGTNVRSSSFSFFFFS